MSLQVRNKQGEVSGTGGGGTSYTAGPHTNLDGNVIRVAFPFVHSVTAIVSSDTDVSNPGTDTFDGVTVTTGKRLLLINQSTASQNGIWEFGTNSTSPLVRPTDFASGSAVFAYTNIITTAISGTTYAGTFWKLTTTSAVTIDTTSQAWSIHKPAVISGTTLILTQGASVAPTTEGDIQWDTDDNKIKVGDGSGTKTFSDDSVSSGIHGVSGSVVGTSDTQALSNKTLDMFKLAAKTPTTLASNAFALSAGFHELSSETGTADDLETISSSVNYSFVVLKAASTHTITIKTGVGNILLSSGNDVAIDGNECILLFYNGANWVDIDVIVSSHNGLSGLQGGTTNEYYHLTNAQHTDLTDSGDSTLHYHATDRDRGNHTGTQLLSTISDAGTIASQDADSVAITGGSISATDIALKQSTTPTPTDEGKIEWDTDNNRIAIGDGASTKIFSDDSVSSGIHGVSGSIVGTTDTQDLSNKTLDLLKIAAKTSTNLVSDAFTFSAGFHELSSETGTTDNLATINSSPNYALLAIKAAATHTITVKHNTGNIVLQGAADVAITGEDVLFLFYNGSKWSDVFTPSASGGSYYQTIQSDGSAQTQQPIINFIAGTGITLTPANDGGNTRTNLTIASSSSASFDLTAVAGEAISARDFCYIKESDGKIYKIDIDDTTPLIGKIVGVAPSAISSAASGTLRLSGQVTGFSSLTVLSPMYASTTAGGYTQTKPTPTQDGSQIAILEMGFADSTTTMIVRPTKIVFAKYAALANTSSLTINHFADNTAYTRKPSCYLFSKATDSSLTSYNNSNQDSAIQLNGPTGAGGTTTPSSASSSGYGLGHNGSQQVYAGQSFQVTAGYLTQFTYFLNANNGTPTGTLTWEIRTDNSGVPSSTVLMSGVTGTPTASSNNTVNITYGIFLAASTTYWLVLYPTTTQSSSTGYVWAAASTNPYANGTAAQNSAGTWTAFGSDDMRCSITTSAISTAYSKLSQSFQIASTSYIDRLTLYMRKVGSPTGTMTVRIETDSSGPSGTLVSPNATITLAESGLGTSFADTAFVFDYNFSISSSTTFWIVVSTDRSASASNYVEIGIDNTSASYANGQLAYYGGSWTLNSSLDSCFSVTSALTWNETAVIGRWSTGTRDIAIRYDDGSGANSTTRTTFKNVSGGAILLMAEIEFIN